MTTKERLHQLVDGLSETEADEALQYTVSRHEDKKTASPAGSPPAPRTTSR